MNHVSDERTDMILEITINAIVWTWTAWVMYMGSTGFGAQN